MSYYNISYSGNIKPVACYRLVASGPLAEDGTPAGRALDAMVARPATTLQPQ